MADSEGAGRKISAFERLPLKIRRNIYAKLLKAGNCRRPPDYALVRKYKFETAIFSVNKSTHRESYETLYHDNHFVVVSFNWEFIHLLMTNHKVAVIVGTKPRLVARFRKQDKAVESFFLVADELPRFVRMIHIRKATLSTAMYKFNFRVEANSVGRPNLAIQQVVLEPFRILNVGHQGLKFQESSLRANMAPMINWVRSLARETFEVLQSIAKVSFKAFDLSNFGTACAKFADSQEALKNASFNNLRLADFEYEGFYNSCNQLHSVLDINKAIAGTRAELWDSEILDTFGNYDIDLADPIVTNLDKSLWHHCHALALAFPGCDAGAKDQL